VLEIPDDPVGDFVDIAQVIFSGLNRKMDAINFIRLAQIRQRLS
jgi:hypothetical protein